MQIIKLNAIDSTNDFLKQLSSTNSIENWTVVTAQSQTKGKGQMGSHWFSESGKNLIMSILVQDSNLTFTSIYSLNAVISIAIHNVLTSYKIPNLSIKWPNDIMSDNKKIGGILIENAFKPDQKIDTIIGIGINVNQIDFKNLPKAASLSSITNIEFDIDIILADIFKSIQNKMQHFSAAQIPLLWGEYNRLLFKKGIPIAFEKNDGKKFMAIIQEVDQQSGKLMLLLENNNIESYSIKEIQMLY